MAVLNKIAPASVTGNTAAANLSLTYEPAEQPWTKADIYFYDLNGNSIKGSRITNRNVSSAGQISFDMALGILIANNKYLVAVGKPDTNIKTNQRVMLIMMPSKIEITPVLKQTKVQFTYVLQCAGETLDKYQIEIYEIYGSGKRKAIEVSNIFTNTDTHESITIDYHYSAYLMPGHQYEFNVTTWSKSGLEWKETSNPVLIPQDPIYTSNPALIPVKPIVTNNEEYGYVQIAMPKEIIKYCSSVESHGSNGYTLTIPNDYGCDWTKNCKIYSSITLNNAFSKTFQDTEHGKDSDNNIRIDITTSNIQLTETCCIGFTPKGKFRLLKETRSGEFEELTTIVLPEDAGYIYEDYDLMQGFEYKYYLVPDYENLIGNGAIAAAIKPQWSSIILSDAQGRLLTVQYNPQISSFKTTILEQKQDTLGDKYPFFLRNGDSYYKEFSLSGLISYQADPKNKFQASGMPDFSEQLRATTPSRIELVEQDEMYLERIYKRQVEDWLNNGEPKLLRTAAEGTFIVRLMNVSLSPVEQLGRRLHTFQATAYEIADCTRDNLEKYGLNCLNSHPSNSIFLGDELEGTVTQPKEPSGIISIKNIPYGNGEERYRIYINNNLIVKPTKIKFINNAEENGPGIIFISNMLPNAHRVIVPAYSSKTFDIQGNSIWFYILSENNTKAEIQLLYDIVTLN